MGYCYETKQRVNDNNNITEETQQQTSRASNEMFGHNESPQSRNLLMNRSTSLPNPQRKKVLLQGYVMESSNNNNSNNVEEDLKRTKSLTDDDLDELKGCLDLGFGFNYDEIPELCNTLPALELCYSMSQKFLDDHSNTNKSPDNSPDSGSSPIAEWKFSSPGDHPEDVKARLKFWAQAVACTVRLCS